MSAARNRRWLLVARPDGLPTDEAFRLVEEEAPHAVIDGEIVVRVLYLSVDPTQRNWIARDTYMPAVALGDVVRSLGVGRVVQTKNPGFAVGDLVSGLVGWQDYARFTAADAAGLSKLPAGVPIPIAMSALGLTGLTAYFGLLDVGRPRPGETVVVSAAGGATGSAVGQIARIKGCRVIGITGGESKRRWLTEEAGFEAIDYKSEDLGSRLRALCPNGIDVFFDNVGGEQLELALDNLATGGRIVLCGAISQYNQSKPPPGPSNYLNLLLRSGRMQGFLFPDYLASIPEAAVEIAGWLQSGALTARVDVEEGLERAPEALRRIFRGDNFGKQLVRVADPDAA